MAALARIDLEAEDDEPDSAGLIEVQADEPRRGPPTGAPMPRCEGNTSGGRTTVRGSTAGLDEGDLAPAALPLVFRGSG